MIFILMKNIVPHTTRPERPGEEHGKEYYFIDFGKNILFGDVLIVNFKVK